MLDEEWLVRMEEFFARRARIMPPNNRKQAMLPAGAEMLDNPIGTACGFALDIGRARFFFTPGVPRELRRMLEEQIIPRLLARSGAPASIFLKRFHSYGLGESHVDQLLSGVEEMVPDGGGEAGLPRALSADRDQADGARHAMPTTYARKLEPVQAEVRKRLGNFILAEDDQTLEGVVLAALTGAARLAGGGGDLHRRRRSRCAWRRCRAPSMCSAAASWCAIWIELHGVLGLEHVHAGRRR